MGICIIEGVFEAGGNDVFRHGLVVYRAQVAHIERDRGWREALAFERAFEHGYYFGREVFEADVVTAVEIDKASYGSHVTACSTRSSFAGSLVGEHLRINPQYLTPCNHLTVRRGYVIDGEMCPGAFHIPNRGVQAPHIACHGVLVAQELAVAGGDHADDHQPPHLGIPLRFADIVVRGDEALDTAMLGPQVEAAAPKHKSDSRHNSSLLRHTLDRTDLVEITISGW